MVEYTVIVKSEQKSEEVYITLIGEKGESKAHSLFSKDPLTISCEESLGDLFMVRLEARPWKNIFDEWFCEAIEVTTPAGVTKHFPCYEGLDNNKTVVRLMDRNATHRGYKEQKDLALRWQRQRELQWKRKKFGWVEYLPKLPWIINIDEENNLPSEFKFKHIKEEEMRLNPIKAMAELELKSFCNCSDSWKKPDEVCSHFPKDSNEKIKNVMTNWKRDEFFGYQLLNGLNPMMIKHCSELPKNFPVTDDMVKLSFPKSSLSEEMQKGNIFLCDYERLDNLEGNIIATKQQYLAAPLCLLFSTPDKKLIPIAIQLMQKPSKDNPIFLPSDSEWDWLLAKTFVRNAEFSEHELNYHLLCTHLLAEVFTVATLRNLSSVHPLFKLLKPHTRYTLPINIRARHTLISDGGIFSEYTAIGREIQTFLTRAFSSLTYSLLCLPENIKQRGLENIPNYYYRDDGLVLWDIILRFVEKMLKHYYKKDADVTNDSELQKWIGEIFHFGFGDNVKTGIPQSFNSVDELIKFVTMVIFTVSAQHAAVNNGQFEYGGVMPNFPSSLRLPPPKKKGKSTETTFLDTLPDVNTTVHIIATLYSLGKKSNDQRQLGDYKEKLFGDDVQTFIDKFKEELQEFDQQIEKRNKGLKVPYDYLQPRDVDNSVGL